MRFQHPLNVPLGGHWNGIIELFDAHSAGSVIINQSKEDDWQIFFMLKLDSFTNLLGDSFSNGFASDSNQKIVNLSQDQNGSF